MSDRDDRWERWVQEALRGRHLDDAPAASIRRARALGSRLPSPAPRGAAWLVRLLFDSAAQPLPAGVRTAGSAQRRLLYRADRPGPPPESCQLDLRVRREPTGGFVLTGQLLPPWPDAEVSISSGGASKKHRIGETGEFLFRDLAQDADSLSIRISSEGEDVLSIEQIPLAEPGQDPK